MKDEDNIRWEGLFIDDVDEIERIIKSLDLQWNCLPHVVTNYHITTEYNLIKKHKQFYGQKAIIKIKGYLIDNQIQNPRYNYLTTAKGFLVDQIKASDKKLQAYLDSLHKKFHITTSYIHAAVDMNYADYHKIIPYTFMIEGTFGGYDDIHQKAILC